MYIHSFSFVLNCSPPSHCKYGIKFRRPWSTSVVLVNVALMNVV